MWGMKLNLLPFDATPVDALEVPTSEVTEEPEPHRIELEAYESKGKPDTEMKWVEEKESTEEMETDGDGEEESSQRFACEPEPVSDSPSTAERMAKKRPGTAFKRYQASVWVNRPYWFRGSFVGKRAIAVICGHHHYSVLVQ